jgi:hypothetical protein
MLRVIERWVDRFGHAQLLGALALLMLIHPFAKGDLAEIVLNVLLLVTLLSAILACAFHRGLVIVGLVLIALQQGAQWYRYFQDIEGVTLLSSGLSLVFFAYIITLVLLDVFRARSVSLDTICGALAAYLLMGLWWAFAYALLETLLPGSIVGLRSDSNGYDQFLSYSFVTLTTLGYGNVVPGNPQADSLASAEAVVGQFYLTVLVARLVALNLVSSREGEE